MNRKTLLLLIVASLGYFVDIYDIALFGIIKKESLESFMPHATEAQAALVTKTGMFLFNMQMIGMLIGGLLWGILGDKKGRLSVLFGSILLYSIANIINAFVFNVEAYAFTRVLAGIGLAGELGAGITLVSELMTKETRGYGTMVIVTFGALGAVTAEMVHRNSAGLSTWFNNSFGVDLMGWQVVYILGGVMGLLLLALRIGSMESIMFKKTKEKGVAKGDIRILFTRKNFLKYLKCILIGIPVWYVIGILVFNSQTIFGPQLGVTGTVDNGTAVMYAYIGLSVGDLLSGILSQILKSRKKVVFIYLGFTLLLVIYFLFFCEGISVNTFYLLTFLLGAGTGYWAIFVTIAAEQFGTNIRSTVTNTVPNFVRGSLVLLSLLFTSLIDWGSSQITSAVIVGVISLILALWAIISLKETFSKDLDYLEEHK
jgi:MFS family permease